MATSGRGTGIVGYNVQTAVDAEHHLIVSHEVTNVGHDGTQLAPMALKAQEATGCGEITALADRGYFNGEQVLACEGTGVLPCVPKTLWPSLAERGFFTRQDFVFDAERDHYTCPAGAKLTRGAERSDRKDDIDHYRHLTACLTCAVAAAWWRAMELEVGSQRIRPGRRRPTPGQPGRAVAQRGWRNQKRETRMIPRIVAPMAFLLLALAQSQASAEPRWTFCVAQALGTKDVWVTDLFVAQVDRERLETGLRSLLEREGHARVVAQCPRPSDDKVAVVNSQTTAEEFNRKLGSVLHEVPARDVPQHQ